MEEKRFREIREILEKNGIREIEIYPYFLEALKREKAEAYKETLKKSYPALEADDLFRM